MTSRLRAAFVGLLVVALSTALFLLATAKPPVLGFTYSAMYAEHLGLAPVDSFERIVSEMPFDFVRLPVYWDRYEPLNDLWNTKELGELLDIAERNNVSVILAVGQKVPRWPECFAPSWARELSSEDYEAELLAFTQKIVTDFGAHPAVDRWQVENESYFPFGNCEAVQPELIRAQTKLVRELGRGELVQTTVSGEQGVGFSKAALADIIGFSLYRSVSVPGIGDYTFPHTPFFYRVQKGLVGIAGKRAVISELQAEPWGLDEFDLTTAEGVRAGYEAFTEEKIREQLLFARRTGMNEISIWGVEWWLALAHRGEGRLWEGARTILEEI